MNRDNKKFIVETIFLKEAVKKELSLKEFLVLMYFDNREENTFDIKKISKALCLSEEDVLSSFGMLLEKKIIVLNSEKNESGKLVDKVCLDNFYNIIKEDQKSNKEKVEFFEIFQEKYGRSLSGMDYEIINAWLANGFSESLILKAVDEANYNGVISLRYIDKILFEWNKKGIKEVVDINPQKEVKTFAKAVMEYNWLDDEE